MTKKTKLLLLFSLGIFLISAMGYLLLYATESGKTLGLLLIITAIFIALLRYINKVKNSDIE